MKKLIMLLITLLPLTVFAEGMGAPKAPDFTLMDTQGNKRSLSEFKGKIVVLEWFNEGCPFVKKHYETNSMQALQKEYTDKGVVWLTISSSGEGKQGYHDANGHNEKIKEWKINSTAFLMDPDGKVGKLYGAKTTPNMYVISKDGSLEYSGAIDDRPSTDKEDIIGANNYVKNALDELLAGKAVSNPTTIPYGCSVKYSY